MRRAIVALFVVAACGGKSAAPATATPAPQPHDLAEIERDACACTTLPCAREEQANLDQWKKQNADAKGSTDILDAIDACLEKASGLAACDGYATAVAAYVRCDKIPQAARDALQQGLETMRSGWAEPATMSDDARKAASDACQAATDAVKQSASALGCAL